MKERRITFYSMGKAIGMDRGSLYKSLKDGSNLEWNTIMKVLDYLGYEICLARQKRRGR